jgi:hypothetical protein
MVEKHVMEAAQVDDIMTREIKVDNSQVVRSTNGLLGHVDLRFV